MNVDASPETIRNTAKALELAQLLDDRVAHVDQARIAAWAVQIEPYRLSVDDLLAGVRAYYADPRDRAIGVGDLIGAARSIRKDRAERETREELNARYEPDPRIAGVIEAVVDRLPAVPDPPTYTRPSQRTDGKPSASIGGDH